MVDVSKTLLLKSAANLAAVVASHAELQHFVKALAPGEQPAKAPGSCPQTAATHPFILPIALDLQKGSSRPNVHQQVGIQISVSCTTQALMASPAVHIW